MCDMSYENFWKVGSEKERNREFCDMVARTYSTFNEIHRMSRLKDLRDIMNDTSIFPDVKDFFKFALENDQLKAVMFLHDEMELNIHEVKFEDGKSALHYLSVCKYNLLSTAFLVGPHHRDYSDDAKSLIDYFLKNAVENYCDGHGFTYFHAACLIGDLETVQRFIREGVDVNLKTYGSSPLYMAANRRHPEIVRILLSHGAEPNWIDAQRSTALHGLARLRVCDCCDCTPSTDPAAATALTPVDVITDLLVANGADIEARNVRGYTPLEWAVSRLDYDSVKALLKHDACLDTLNDNISFSTSDYEPFQLVQYPIVLYIPEMIQLLTTSGFEMDFIARFRFLEFWTTVRRKEMEKLRSFEGDLFRKMMLEHRLFLHEKCGFFLKPEAVNHLRKELRKRLPSKRQLEDSEQEEKDKKLKEFLLDQFKGLMVNEDTSLYEICQMSFIDGYSILKKVKNFSLPIDRIDFKFTWDTVQRHIANIFMRPQLELFATDLFGTNHCDLNLPAVPCRRIAKYMRDEDLIRLCEHTTENDLKQPLPANETNENDLQKPLPAKKANENYLKQPLPANEANASVSVAPRRRRRQRGSRPLRSYPMSNRNNL